MRTITARIIYSEIFVLFELHSTNVTCVFHGVIRILLLNQVRENCSSSANKVGTSHVKRSLPVGKLVLGDGRPQNQCRKLDLK